MKEHHAQKTDVPHGKEPLRLLALSDGLFATVLTLLVLDLRIPDALNANGGNMTAFLSWIGPHLFSYLLTFLVTGTYWMAHHRDFDQVATYDRSLLGYNLLFLLFIGLLPFTTANISLVSINSSNYPFYWAIYAANIILAGIMLNLTRNYAVSHGLVTPGMTRQESLHGTVRQIVTPAVFLVSIGVNFLFPRTFLGPYTLLLIPLIMWGVDQYYARIYPKKPPQPLTLADLLWRGGQAIFWLLLIGLAVWLMAL
jgi:uncharacterized membrane protein